MSENEKRLSEIAKELKISNVEKIENEEFLSEEITVKIVTNKRIIQKTFEDMQKAKEWELDVTTEMLPEEDEEWEDSQG